MIQLDSALQPYLFSVRPADGELVSSYLARLAEANNLHPKQVLDQITDTSNSWPSTAAYKFPTRTLELNRPALARLAQLSGHTEHALKLALTVTFLPGGWNRPAARLRQRPRARADAWAPTDGCRRCAAGSPTPIIAFRDDRVFCRRHRLWLADQHDAPPFPIDEHPELRAAVTLMRRTYRRYGRKTHRAFNAAHSIWAAHEPRRRDVDVIRNRWASRAARMNLTSGTTTLAPRYPDVATLTAMIANPGWKTAAGRLPGDSRPDIETFLAELARRLCHPAPDRFAAHPGAIGQWALTLRNFHPDRDRLELAGPIDLNLHIRRKAIKGRTDGSPQCERLSRPG